MWEKVPVQRCWSVDIDFDIDPLCAFCRKEVFVPQNTQKKLLFHKKRSRVPISERTWKQNASLIWLVKATSWDQTWRFGSISGSQCYQRRKRLFANLLQLRNRLNASPVLGDSSKRMDEQAKIRFEVGVNREKKICSCLLCDCKKNKFRNFKVHFHSQTRWQWPFTLFRYLR